jgi:two-component system, chemotaxis family, protein-glutamate methylesterase/glutaminase
MKTGKFKLLVIGGSAGALSMVIRILPLLKKEMHLSVIIVFHRMPADDNVLTEVLTARTEFAVKEADDKDVLSPGNIYLAPADYHILIEKDGSLTLDDSEKVNFSRPSIDVTFESAAEVYGPALACMLLSGANSDGTDGLARAKESGAFIIVQDPLTAEVPFMPRSAVSRVDADLILTDQTLPEIARLFLPKDF